MRTFIFKLKLLLHLLVFFSSYILHTRPVVRPILVGILATLCIGILFINITLLSAQVRPPEIITAYTPLQEEGLQKRTLPRAEIMQELELLQEIERVQPATRDILLNIALLHFALNQPKSAEIYLEKARQIDPIHPLVQRSIE